MPNKNYGVIIAARMSSSRLPNKALLPFDNTTMIEFLIRRLLGTKYINCIVLATSDKEEDNILEEIAKKHKIKSYRGDLDDVSLRYIEAANMFSIDNVIRVTGDCPFVSSELVEYCIENINTQKDFVLFSTKGYFPTGLDIEIYKSKELEKAYIKNRLNIQNKEHVTQYFYENSIEYPIYYIKPKLEWKSEQVYTVDYQDDYFLFNKIDNAISLANLVKLFR